MSIELTPRELMGPEAGEEDSDRDSGNEEEPATANARVRAMADALERPHRSLAPLGAVGAAASSDTGVLRHSVGVDGLPGPSTLFWPVSEEDARRDARAADPGESAAAREHPQTSNIRHALAGTRGEIARRRGTSKYKES